MMKKHLIFQTLLSKLLLSSKKHNFLIQIQKTGIRKEKIMLPIITTVDCVINRNKIKFACQYPKLNLILGKLIKQKKRMKNKVVNIARPVTVLVDLLLDAIWL